MNRFILICLLAHILGDFYIQCQKLSDLKNKKYVWLLVHSALYAIPYFTFYFLLNDRKKHLLPFIVIVGLHWFFDTVKWFVNKKITNEEEIKIQKVNLPQEIEQKEEKFQFYTKFVYVVDQCLHIMTILGVTIYFRKSIDGITLESVRTTIHSIINTSITDITKTVI